MKIVSRVKQGEVFQGYINYNLYPKGFFVSFPYRFPKITTYEADNRDGLVYGKILPTFTIRLFRSSFRFTIATSFLPLEEYDFIPNIPGVDR